MEALVFRHIFSFIFSLLLSYYLIPLLVSAARRFGLLDHPDGRIKIHKEPIPCLGGVGIYCAFIATLLLVYPFADQIVWLLLGSSLLLFVGFVDDLKALRPSRKFSGQILAVLCFLRGGFSLKTVFFSSATNLFFSAFWMLSVINAFNLIDVMDGLSSIVALVVALTFCLIAILFGQYTVSIMLLAFVGALIAFFLYNKPPAKIYLGDGGALFVGGFLSAIPLLLSWSERSFDAYYVAVVIIGVPLLEVSCLVAIRSYLGMPFYYGSPHHFAIYLQKKGWSKEKVLVFAASMSTLLSGFALAFLYQYINFLELLACGALFLIVWGHTVFSGMPQMLDNTDSKIQINDAISVHPARKSVAFKQVNDDTQDEQQKTI